MNVWFLDWLTIQQDHDDERLPLVGDAEVSSVDLNTGLCQWTTVKGRVHKGSWESSLLVRCDGRRVSVSGNPSRFGRPDNFQGFTDLRDAIALYNTVLVDLGLPPFSDDASISRVDCTTNHRTGGDRELLAAMRYLSGQRHYRSPTVWPDFRGVQFGKTKGYTSLKFYDKGTELARKMPKEIPFGPVTKERALAQWCSENGVIREEWTLGRKWLHENRLTRAGMCCMGKIVELIEHKRDIPRRLETTRVRFVEIAERLVDLEVCKTKSAAVRLQGYAYAWASGSDLRAELTLSTFYRIRRQLLNVGLDIAHPMDVARVTPSPDQVTLTPAAPPAWYVLPQVA